MKNWNDLTCREKMSSISLYKDESLKDENDLIRLCAMRAHGFTHDAFHDFNDDIRHEADLYFKINAQKQFEQTMHNCRK